MDAWGRKIPGLQSQKLFVKNLDSFILSIAKEMSKICSFFMQIATPKGIKELSGF